MARILTSFFIVMRKTGSGQEAIVDPSQIRRDIVELIKSDRDHDPSKIEYIYHNDFGVLKDVTDELIGEASYEKACDSIRAVLPHPQYVAWDKAADYRKNGERV